MTNIHPHDNTARLSYTVVEAAELLGIGRDLAYGPRPLGPASRTVQLGRRIVVPKRALDELLGEAR